MSTAESIEDRLVEVLGENPTAWEASDETGTVRASVDPAGALRTLELAPSWWRQVRPEELGPLVLRLRQESAMLRLNTVSALEDEGLRRADTGAPPVTMPRTPDADSLDISRLSSRLGDVLSAFSDLDRYRKAVRASVSEPTELRSPSGNVTLELVGGSPRRLEIDKMNVQLVSEREIADEIIELFDRARNWFAERRAELMEEMPALARTVESVRGA